MKKILFLFAIAALLVSCNNFDRSKIKKLDNMYANNDIMRCTVIRYNYNAGILDSISTDTVSVEEYGLRGNLKYSLDKQQNEYRYNSFKGTTMTESEVYRLSDNSFLNKITYTYKDNTVTDSYLNKEGKLERKIVRVKDDKDRDTLYEVYNNENKLIMKYVDTYDGIGSKLLTCNDYENPQFDYTRSRINDDKYNMEFVQKSANDSIVLEDKIGYDKSGRRTEYTRLVHGTNENVLINFKYTYLTEDGLIDTLVYYNESGEPLYVHRYVYDKY